MKMATFIKNIFNIENNLLIKSKMIFYINSYILGLPCNIFSFFLALILFRRELETAAEIIVNNLGIKKKNNIDKHKKESY